jgi:hypothetical protein
MKDADRLDKALEGASEPVRDDLEELVALAGEVGEALSAPMLSTARRELLYLRALGAAASPPERPRWYRRVPRRPALLGAAGGLAAVTVGAAVAVAVIRARSGGAVAPAA